MRTAPTANGRSIVLDVLGLSIIFECALEYRKMWDRKIETRMSHSSILHFSVFLLSSSPPNFKRDRRRADNRQRVIRRVNVLGQSQNHFRRGYQKRHQALRPLLFHRRPRVGDHKENEKLIHRPGDRRDLGPEAVVSDQTS